MLNMRASWSIQFPFPVARLYTARMRLIGLAIVVLTIPWTLGCVKKPVGAKEPKVIAHVPGIPSTTGAARIVWRSPTTTTVTGSYYCHSEGAMKTGASMCRPDPEDCENERKAAIAEGMTASDCILVSPVACFQIGGEPDLAFEWCAGSMGDCRLWLHMDEKKNGVRGEKCVMKH